MKSKQVMLTLALLLLGGCSWFPSWMKPHAGPLVSPYASRKVWAVVPLRNESGSQQADGAVIADHFVKQLQNASNIDVLAVNRVLAAMQAMQMEAVKTPEDAQRLINALGVDYLLIGSITAYDPYDPPKIGMSIELFTSRKLEAQRALNLRNLSSSATDQNVSTPPPADAREPVSRVSAFLDAADQHVREQLQTYARDRSQGDNEESSWILYRINMDLYSEFATYVMSWRLLQAERERFAPALATQPAH